jgi:hypothetical protein
MKTDSIIFLDRWYKLENDSNGWVLIYEKEGEINPKTNEPIISRNKWYCGSLHSALKRYLDECLKPSTDIQELFSELSMAMERIVELYK